MMPNTPEAAYMATHTYLMATKPTADDPPYAAYQTAMAGMGMMGRVVADKGPAPRPDRSPHHQSSPRHGGEPVIRRSRSPRHPQDNTPVANARDTIAQNRVDRSREERDTREYNEDEMCGVNCFTRRIRKTRVPHNFQMPDKYRKFDGLQDPDEWITDYLETVKIRGGNKATAMQSIQDRKSVV